MHNAINFVFFVCLIEQSSGRGQKINNFSLMMKNFSLIESAPTRARTQRDETKLELENDLKAN